MHHGDGIGTNSPVTPSDALGFEVTATDGSARCATATTARGSFATPCFMPVGTRAAVRALSTVDLEEIGFDVLLANTYHLMLRPGVGTVRAAGGVHGFAAWSRHVLTDSGGFQAFSLRARQDETGVHFRSVYDGSPCTLTPEGAVEAQRDIGSDIQMVLDVCVPLPSPRDVIEEAMDRTLRWAERALVRHRANGHSRQAIFGIVQGGDDRALREASARALVSMGFDGYGIGGLSVGEPPPARRAALEAAVAHLPSDRPRYVMGLGDPVGVVEAVARGADMFDCVLPTRLGRHGTLLTDRGRLNLRRAEFTSDMSPIEDGCPCATCSRYARSYLRHLFVVGDPTAMRLATIHNLSWMARFVEGIRAAITAGRFAGFAADVAAAYGADVPSIPVR